MNYNSLDSMLNTTENMDIIRNNSKVDEGTDTINGVDWFKFNNVVVSKIYINSNSWVGLGTNSQQFKICYRDGAIWYLYREEGTLYNYYKFLKIRWEGFSYYGSTDIQYKLVWELFLFDTGDMFLNVIQVPTNSSYLGTSTILLNGTNMSLGIELGTPVMISLYHDDENGVSYTIKKEKLDIKYPFDVKYLIRSEEKYYTMVDGMLSEIKVDILNSDVFKNQGFNKPESFSFLKDMKNPDLLNWVDTDIDVGNLSIKCIAMPYDQILMTKSYDTTDPSIIGIDSISVDTDNVYYQFSFDNGASFEIFKNGEWITANDEWMSKNEVMEMKSSNFDLKDISVYGVRMKLIDQGYMKCFVVNYRNGE